MPERTTVTQAVQLGIESTAGTAVAATKILPSLEFATSIAGSWNTFRPQGYKFNTINAPGKEWAEAKLSGPATYSEIVYLLSSLLNYAAPVQIATSGAYTWTHTPSSTAPDTVKTYTIEQGSSVRAHKFAGGQVSELTLTGDREKVDLSGSMLGASITDGITLTALGGGAAVAQQPVLPKHVSVYLDSTSGGLGTTLLTRVLSWELGVSGKFGPLWTVDASQSSYATTVETPVDAKAKIRVEADAAGMGILTQARAGTTKWMRIEAVSDQNAGTSGTNKYKLTMDCAVQIGDPPGEIGDTDGVYALDWNFNIVHDSTWGKAMTVAVVNSQSAL